MAAKFQRLRRRLDQLGYRQPLPLEALPLAERLFSDLVATTEALRGATEAPAHGQGQRAEADRVGGGAEAAQAELYRSDNARLVKVREKKKSK